MGIWSKNVKRSQNGEQRLEELNLHESIPYKLFPLSNTGYGIKVLRDVIEIYDGVGNILCKYHWDESPFRKRHDHFDISRSPFESYAPVFDDLLKSESFRDFVMWFVSDLLEKYS